MTRVFAQFFDDPSMRSNAHRLSRRTKLKPGELTPNTLDLSTGQVHKMLGEVARLVADIPRGSSPEVVWTLGSSELLVHTNTARVKFTSGVVWFRVMVECDQVQGQARITIPFAVGTKDRPTGLVMGTYDIVEGPDPIVEQWSDALIAFGWECVLELGRRLSAEMGEDASGRSLVPGSISAAPGKLTIQPMARHDLLTRARR